EKASSWSDSRARANPSAIWLRQELPVQRNSTWGLDDADAPPEAAIRACDWAACTTRRVAETSFRRCHHVNNPHPAIASIARPPTTFDQKASIESVKSDNQTSAARLRPVAAISSFSCALRDR